MTTHNPMYKVMLKDFLNHLERRDSSSGWMIIDKGLYRDNSSFCKNEVSRGGEIVLILFAKWKAIGDKDIEYEIDNFLRGWDEKHSAPTSHNINRQMAYTI